MICQHCGAGISDDRNFCTYCGVPVISQDADFSPCFAYPLPNDSAETPVYKLDLGKLLGDTFELYKRHFGTMCYVGLFMAGLPFIFSIGGVLLGIASEVSATEGHSTLVYVFVGLYVFMLILQKLAQWYLMLGAIRHGLFFARGGTGFQANQMFPPLMMFMKVAGFNLLFLCIVCGILLLSLLPGGTMLAVAWSIDVFADNGPSSTGIIVLIVAASLFFVAGLYASVWCSMRLLLTQMFIADQNTGIIHSMQYAWRVTSGNFWMLFVSVIIFWIFAMMGLLFFCVGIILTIAVPWLGATLAYMQLTGQPNCLDYQSSFPFSLAESDPDGIY